jgi:glycerol-3-phosphate dehydrogenase (NAD(P)+)
MPKVAIVGTTHWGMTLGMVLARNEVDVSLWARTEEEAERVRRSGPSPVYAPEIKFPPCLTITASPAEAVSRAKALILAVPSQTMRRNIKIFAEHIRRGTLIVSAAKGLEIGSNKRMSEVIADETSPRLHPFICALSGPNLSREILKELPASTVIAAEDEGIAKTAQKLFTTPSFCVFTNSDIIGVELGGALKNIIALAAGMLDGLGAGDNAKAALITRGLTEMTALGAAMGANPLTFSGLAGMGDLITTCASALSRNHYVGVELTKGRSLEEITSTMTAGIAEGVPTTVAAWSMAQGLGMEMPITQRVHQVLYEGIEPKQVMSDFIGLRGRNELSGRRWKLFSFFRRPKKT